MENRPRSWGLSNYQCFLNYRFSSVSSHFDRLSNLFAEDNKYFVDYISKAYQALTDKVARENYEKYGHPDGRQVCNHC